MDHSPQGKYIWKQCQNGPQSTVLIKENTFGKLFQSGPESEKLHNENTFGKHLKMENTL